MKVTALFLKHLNNISTTCRQHIHNIVSACCQLVTSKISSAVKTSFPFCEACRGHVNNMPLACSWHAGSMLSLCHTQHLITCLNHYSIFRALSQHVNAISWSWSYYAISMLSECHCRTLISRENQFFSFGACRQHVNGMSLLHLQNICSTCQWNVFRMSIKCNRHAVKMSLPKSHHPSKPAFFEARPGHVNSITFVCSKHATSILSTFHSQTLIICQNQLAFLKDVVYTWMTCRWHVHSMLWACCQNLTPESSSPVKTSSTNFEVCLGHVNNLM